MMRHSTVKVVTAFLAIAALTSCGKVNEGNTAEGQFVRSSEPDRKNTIWSAFNRGNDDTKVLVNKYLWSSSLEVLNFLPVQSVDPFTGVIVTGYGTPPGGGRPYRATILINDPALDARSLNVALQTKGGPASKATVRAVEDAILSRARQKRIADNKF